MIFAAGLGTRLKPLTDTMPKALVPYKGEPMLKSLVVILKESGFQDIVVNVHHFADQIDDYLAQNGNFGVSIRTSDERDLLRETGGGIRHAASLLKGTDPILVHNVDIVTNLDYSSLLDNHKIEDLATLIVSDRKTSRYLLFDDENRLVGWTNIETGQVKSPYVNLNPDLYKKMAFSGVHIVSPKIFEVMKTWPEKFSIIDFYLSVCMDYPVRALTFEGLEVRDLGKIADFH